MPERAQAGWSTGGGSSRAGRCTAKVCMPLSDEARSSPAAASDDPPASGRSAIVAVPTLRTFRLAAAFCEPKVRFCLSADAF